MFDNWIVCFTKYDHDTDKMMQALGCRIDPEEFLIYGKIEKFLRASGLRTDTCIAFHEGSYVGTWEDVAEYLKKKDI